MASRPQLVQLVRKTLAPNGRFVYTGFWEKDVVDAYREPTERGSNNAYLLGNIEGLLPQPTIILPPGYEGTVHLLLVSSLTKPPSLLDKVKARFGR